MKNLKIALMMVIAALAPVAAHAFGAEQFSAEMISTAQGQVMQAKLFVGDHKTRVEMPQATMIMRADRGVAWILMPEQNMYMEQPVDPKMAAQTSKELPGEMERKSMGREDVNGVNAEKFLVKYTQNGRTESVYQWLGPNGIPIRTAALDGSWSADFKNIQMGPQPDSLFEPPAGYEKFAMPDVAQMMQQAAAQQE